MSASDLSRRPVVVVETAKALRDAVGAARRSGLKIGLTPTMGALHAGHQSLMHAARSECGFVVATIFVNPTHFGPHEDFHRYPRDLARDLAACEAAGVDLVFHPPVAAMYPADHVTFVEVAGLSNLWEGKSRPGHFRGVATVVLKLLNLVTPDIAYFGQKDFQQQAIIRRMCRNLDLPVEIRVCPIVRDADGLALSSRNVYLSAEDRAAALALSRCLQVAAGMVGGGETDLALVRRAMRKELAASPRVEPDYATLVDPETLEEVDDCPPRLAAIVAARVGTTRLIDNLLIDRCPPCAQS